MVGLKRLMGHYTSLWQRCDGRGVRLGRRYTAPEQARREKGAEEFLKVVESKVAQSKGRVTVDAGLLQAFGVFARSAVDLSEAQVKTLVEGAFPRLLRALATEARAFDPAISPADVFQASRNVWTASGLQTLLGRPPELTPAIFGYSLLYPYTDNLLDDPATRQVTKHAFNRRLRERLLGDTVHPANDREQKVWGLVERIESQYKRTRHPRVYRSLLAIHKAQEESVHLRRDARLPAAEVLRMVFEKGGTSVLADGYLAKGRLTADEELFAFGWGVLLQLGDDLQDVAEDLAGGAATLFSESAGREPLDELTNRVFQFSGHVFAGLRAFERPGLGPLKQLIRRSAVILLTTAAGGAGRFYTSRYVHNLEQHSPLRFGFLREHRERFFGSGGLVRRFVGALT